MTNILLTFNTERKPFDDVARAPALTLAIDRWGGSQSLGKVIADQGRERRLPAGRAVVAAQGGAREDAGLLAATSRSRAPRPGACCKEAGHPNLKLKLVNRTIDQPFIPAGIYAVDQWRRIGVDGRARAARDQAVVCGHGGRRVRRGGAEHLRLRRRSRPRSSTRCSASTSRASPTRATATPSSTSCSSASRRSSTRPSG